MPQRRRLEADVDAEPWALLRTLDLESALAEPFDPRAVPQPLRIELDGKSEASLVACARGFGDDATTDVIVSPALDAILATARLPRHVRIACVAAPFVDLLGTRGRVRRAAERPMFWYWWTETFGARLDPRRSRFRILYLDEPRVETHYEDLDDLRQMKKRAIGGRGITSFDPLEVAWTDPAVDELDLVPYDGDLFVSDALAHRIAEAALPGIDPAPLQGTDSRVMPRR